MRHLDLNLLRVFLAVYKERGAQRAGAHLGVTQSAISHGLARLREYFDDPLFVRAPGGLKPTARAVELIPVIEDMLMQLRAATGPTKFDPATTRRAFTLSSPPYLAELLLPAVIARARQEAPLVQFRIWCPRKLCHQLDLGNIDIALGRFPVVPSRFCGHHVLDDKFVWIVGKDYPSAHEQVSLQSFADMQQVMTAAADYYLDADEYVTEGELTQRVVNSSAEIRHADVISRSAPAIWVDNGKVALALVKATAVICYVPYLLARADLDQGEVKLLKTPELETHIPVTAIWRRDASEDPAHRWLREILFEVAGEFAPSSINPSEVVVEQHR